MTQLLTRPKSASTMRPSLRTNLKLFALLMVAALFGLAAIVPYSLALTGTAVPDDMFWTVVLVSAVQSLVLVAPLTALGLWLGSKVGLGAPMLAAVIERQPGAGRELLCYAVFAIGIGGVTGAAVLLGALAFMPWMPLELGQAPVPTWWQALLASFSAGITEELMLRLGLMTLLVWLGTKVTRREQPSAATIWTANGIAAVLFGLGHLPLVASLAPLTALIVIRTLVLNGFAGIVLGLTYWRYGLIAAMVAHASADVVLHVLSRLLVPA
jgi:membrane protease YdiL (CAAX protease family)